MKLNLAILQDYLPKEYRLKRYNADTPALLWGRPVLYETGDSLLEGILYIARTETLPKEPFSEKIAVICIGGKIESVWSGYGAQLLHITTPFSFIKVFNDINNVYNYFDAWEQQLRDELEKIMDFDMKQILTIGIRVLKNRINVIDHTLQVLFRANIIPQADNTYVIDTQDTPCPLDLVHAERVKDVCRLEQIITVPYMSSMYSQDKHYCCNLYLFEHFMGCISITDENHPFQDSDMALSNYFFSYFQKAFLRYLQSFHQKESLQVTALRNLMKHTPLSFEENQQLLLQENEFWCCFKLKENRKEKFMPHDYMCATLNAIMPRTVSAIINHGEITGLLRINRQEKESILDSFSQFLLRMNYSGSVSNPFEDAHCFQDYLSQAEYVAENCIPSVPDKALYFFQDYVLTYMLYECTGKLPMNTLYSNDLARLIHHDQLKSANLLHTLNIYLKHEMNLTRTSEALYIHRSSLIKRLDRIKKLTRDSLDDPMIRLYYRMCFARWELNPEMIPEGITLHS